MDEISMRHDESVALSGAPDQRLPVLHITARSYAFLWQEWRILVLPVLSLALMMWVIPEPSSIDLGDWFTILIALAPTALFMPALEVGLFRRLVLDEPRRHLALFCLTKALVTYSIVGVKLFLWLVLACLPALVLLANFYFDDLDGNARGSMVTAIWPGLLIGAGALLLAFRLAPILPAAATGAPIGFRQAWILTKGNGLRMVAIVALTAIPPMAVSAILPAQLSAILQALAVPVRVVGLAISYRLLTAPAAQASSPAP
jgi:hypothetical protein